MAAGRCVEPFATMSDKVNYVLPIGGCIAWICLSGLDARAEVTTSKCGGWLLSLVSRFSAVSFIAIPGFILS